MYAAKSCGDETTKTGLPCGTRSLTVPTVLVVERPCRRRIMGRSRRIEQPEPSSADLNAPLRLRPRHAVSTGGVYVPTLPAAPTFYPTTAEMDDFCGYVAKIQEEAKAFGICKVVPPASWRGPNTQAGPKDTFVLKNSIRQHVSGAAGIYSITHEETNTKSSYAGFSKKANAYVQREQVSDELSHDQLEAKFWKELSTAPPPLYGADLDGSFFTGETTQWNLNALPDLLRSGAAKLPKRMNGINTPMLYFGAFRTLFCAHVEDMDLVSAAVQRMHLQCMHAKDACICMHAF